MLYKKGGVDSAAGLMLVLSRDATTYGAKRPPSANELWRSGSAKKFGGNVSCRAERDPALIFCHVTEGAGVLGFSRAVSLLHQHRDRKISAGFNSAVSVTSSLWTP